MFYNSRPVFLSNTVLKSELLQESADYAAEMFGHLFGAYSDGVIAGASVGTENGKLVVQPGVIKHKGVIYHTSEPVSIPYQNTGVRTFLKLRFSDVVNECECALRQTELVLTEDETAFPYDMELGRFTLEKGAVLQTEYKDFADMATQYNRFQILSVPYAGKGAPTVSPQITQNFASELLAGNTDDVYDIAFAMNGIGGDIISREVICRYLEKRLGPEKYETYSGEQIYRALLQVLLNGGNRRRQAAPASGHRRVIVD